jgi:hypothetical protein
MTNGGTGREIVDLFHARQHLWELARKLYTDDEINQKAWI